MVEDDDAEPQPSSLRGRLSDVFFPAVLGGAEDALAKRFGERATTYNPILGAAAGLSQIAAQLKEFGVWMNDRKTTYTPAHVFIGTDRDVTEGVLALRADGEHVDLPVAIVLERRKAREVALRVYHATQPLRRWQAPRLARGTGEREPAVPANVAEHLALLRLGDVDALVAGFAPGGTVRDGAGTVHTRSTGAMHAFYVRLLQSGPAANDWQPVILSVADDGRMCAVEYETSKLRGEETTPKEGAMVFERGDSGLFSSVRIYDDVMA